MYLIRSASGALYAGITTDLQRRLQEHQGDLAGGAKSLRGKGPLQLVWSTPVANRSAASRLECKLKRMPKQSKEALVAGSRCIAGLLDHTER